MEDTKRKFIIKTAQTSALLTVLSAKPTWGAGITGSIVASGHGSDFANGMLHMLNITELGAYDATLIDSYMLFEDLFGYTAQDFTSTSVIDVSLSDILRGVDTDSNTITYSEHTLVITAVYLNAVNSGNFGIHYPILHKGVFHQLPDHFAQQLSQYNRHDIVNLFYHLI